MNLITEKTQSMRDDYLGLSYASLRNSFLQLDYLTTAGPRLVGLYLIGRSENLLAELPSVVAKTPLGDFRFLGGHRLWHAPEALPRTYEPDDSGLTLEETGTGVMLYGRLESSTGIQKLMHIELKQDTPAVIIRHTLINHGAWPVELAAWAITQFPLGGVAILPQPTGLSDAAGLLPNRRVILWPYTRWSDERLSLDEEYIFIQGLAKLPPIKIGYANSRGWLGYYRDGVFFCKRIPHYLPDTYPDFGANSECFCDNHFLELESLGPLTRLEPGEALQHIETWELYPIEDRLSTQDSLIQAVERLNLG